MKPILLMVAGAESRGTPDTARFLADFVSPARRQNVGSGAIWAADNGCFGAWNEARFLAMLDAAAAAPIPPVFVTVPDVVGDHAGTVALWIRWAREFEKRGLRRAFVLQNGIEQHGSPEFAIPWGSVDALFIGGDDAFKLGAWVRWAVAFAARAEKSGKRIWIHMGRVNSAKRMLYAQRIGCDSCDGSGMAKYPDRLPMMIRHLRAGQGDLL